MMILKGPPPVDLMDPLRFQNALDFPDSMAISSGGELASLWNRKACRVLDRLTPEYSVPDYGG